jgi:NTE family protein
MTVLVPRQSGVKRPPVLHWVVFCALIARLITVGPLSAKEPVEKGPELVLVLSGGGARGVAHIGVLRVLEELRIAPDMVIGTSMGSIIGGLYAAGWSTDEMQELVESTDWTTVFTDRIDREDRSFRRKQDDRPVMIQGRLHFKGLKPVLPSGVIDGQRLELILRTVEALSPATADFDELPISFRAVAADIATGEAVVIGSGSLAMAMRASMSVPGAVPPVVIDGRSLVDGGIAANLPVGIARELGARSIIAVDISSPLLAEEDEDFESFMKVFTHLNSLLTVHNRDRDVARLGPEDVLIRPDLGDISFVSFDRVEEAASIGEQAARLQIDELRPFKSSETRWAAFQKRPRAHALAPLAVDRVRLENASKVDDRLVHKALTLRPPEILDRRRLVADLLELYNTRYFGVIGFQLEEVGEDVHELVVETPPPPYGRGSLQFGIGFIDDFDGGSSYHLQARHQYLPANQRGGEWETLLQLGTVAGVQTSYYQPLDWGMRWFVEPSLHYERGEQEIWFDGQAIAEYSFSTSDVRLAAGRVFGKWGELRLAAFTGENRGSPRIGLPGFQSVNERRGGGEARFRIDTEDSVVFPRAGAEVDLIYTASSESLGAATDIEQIWGKASYAWSMGKYSLVPYIEYGENLGETESFFSAFSLGGPLRLSGLGTNELLGYKIAFARIVGFRRLFNMQLAGMKVNFYAGLSLEAGNAYLTEEAVSWNNTLKGFSVFVGGDTFIGPIVFAYGRTEGDRDRFYLAIGDKF